MCYIKCAENEHLNQTQNNPPQRSTPGHPSGRTVCPRPVSDRLKRFDKTLPYGNVLSYTGVCRGALSRSKSSLRISRRSASYCEGAFNRYASSCERFRYASLPTASPHLKSRRHSPLPLRRSARSPIATSVTVWVPLFTPNNDREPRRFSMALRSSASLPWSAVSRRKVGPVGRSA